MYCCNSHDVLSSLCLIKLLTKTQKTFFDDKTKTALFLAHVSYKLCLVRHHLGFVSEAPLLHYITMKYSDQTCLPVVTRCPCNDVTNSCCGRSLTNHKAERSSETPPRFATNNHTRGSWHWSQLCQSAAPRRTN